MTLLDLEILLTNTPDKDLSDKGHSIVVDYFWAAFSRTGGGDFN